MTSVINCYILLNRKGDIDFMNMIISNNSSVPIYEQIINNIKKDILENTLKENEVLPSVRNLSKDLKISFLTVKKAYDELERQGFIKTVQGKGSFVLPRNSELVREEQLKDIERHIEEIVKISRIAEIEKADIIDLLNSFFEED